MQKIDKVLSTGESILTGTLILASVIVLFVNVIARYFFSAASSWAEEAIRYVCIWITFVGGSQCAKAGTHVGIDLVVQILPASAKRIVAALGQFIAAIFTAICVYAGYLSTQLVVTTNQKSPAMLMPMWIVYICVPLGCLLMSIRFIIAGINALKGDNEGPSITDEDGNVDMSQL